MSIDNGYARQARRLLVKFKIRKSALVPVLSAKKGAMMAAGEPEFALGGDKDGLSELRGKRKPADIPELEKGTVRLQCMMLCWLLQCASSTEVQGCSLCSPSVTD